MHVYYKFGLLLIFILSISISHIQGAPVKNQTTSLNNSSSNSSIDDYDYEDDYYEDATEIVEQQQQQASPETAENRLNPSVSTTTTTFRPTFHIPRRSNHVLEPICPRACICREDYKYVQCTHARLTQMPHDLPKTALIIDLSHNAIKEVHPDFFETGSKAIEINLNSNQLTKLDKEAFAGLGRLQRLRLANNKFESIAPDTFEYASDLSLLDLSNNSIELRKDGSFLNQPSLLELNCNNCSWTQLYNHTFANLSSLTTLRLHHNDFNKKINTQAFTPLRNLIKLKLPELDQSSIQELCNLLKSIDNISFKHFDISCFELVLGTSFNESLIFATDPPFKRVTGFGNNSSTIVESGGGGGVTKAPKNAHNKKPNEMASGNEFNSSSNFTQASLDDANATDTIKASVLGGAGTSSGKKGDGEEEPYQVPISQEAINNILISIMVFAVIGLIIGAICRKDIGGIKTKCCRTSKPEQTTTTTPTTNEPAVNPAEEIPLNKIA